MRKKTPPFLFQKQLGLASCFVAVATLGLSGCGLTINNPALFGGTSVQTTSPSPVVGNAPALQGYVGGQQWWVSGADVQLYAMGTEGMASTATPLLTQTVTTDNSGDFTIPAGYTCPSSSSQLYIVVSGGNPGLASDTNNQAIRLATLLGPCNQLSSSTIYPVNEITTVGSIWPLSSYMTSAVKLGSTPGDPSFTTALATVNQLVNLATAVSPGIGVPAGYAVQSTKINTLASILHACVITGGGTAGDGSSCGQLFSLTTPQGGNAPADTIEAALSLAQANQLNVDSLFQFTPGAAAFQPVLTDVPSDWDLNLLPVPAAPTFAPASGMYPTAQQVTLSTSTAGAAVYYTVDGSQPSMESPVYTSPLLLSSTETVHAMSMMNGVGSPIVAAAYSVTTPVVAPPIVAATHLVFSMQPTNILQGSAFNPVVSLAIVNDAGAIVPSTSQISLQLNKNGGSGTLNGASVLSSVNGIVSFPGLSVSSPGSGYTITASSAGSASATSASFTVSAPASTPPVGTPPAITLSVTNPSISTGSTFTGEVTLSTPAGAGGVAIQLSTSSPKILTVTPSVLNIAAGQTTNSIRYSGISAGSTTLVANAGGTTATATIHVIAPTATATHLVFVSQPSSLTQGATFNPSPAVSLVDESGNVLSTSNAAISITVAGNGVKLNGTTTVNAIGGVATFNGLGLSTVGTGYMLTANSAGLDSITSNPFNVNIPAGAASPIPGNATSTGDLDGDNHWEWNHDPGTPGYSVGSTSYAISSPSLDGLAREFNLSYTDHGGEIYHLSFANDASATHFVYDTYFYVEDSSQLQNVEMDMNQVMADGRTVILGTQCASGSGTWEFTNVTSGNTHWHPSNISCNPKNWSSNSWHHIQIASERDNNGNVIYDWVNFDGTQTNFQGAGGSSVLSLGWATGDLLLNFQLDGASRSSGSITAYMDKLTIYRW